MCPIFVPHFRLYEVVSLHVCVLPYKYFKILEMFPYKLMKPCDGMAGRLACVCEPSTTFPIIMRCFLIQTA